MKSKKKIVLAGLVLLATALLLPLAGCKNDSVLEAEAKYTVTFNANGGTFADGEDTKTETVESGQTIEKPLVTYPVIKNELYRWKDESGAKVEFPLKVEKNMSLTAEWGIKVGDTVYPKTSEVLVLSEEVYLKDLYQAASNSQIFVDKRVDSIQPFVMGQYEVTQQLYFAVMGKNPSGFKTGTENEEPKEGGLPVEKVSWYDAVVFCNKLSELMELEPVYSKGGTTDTSEWGEVPDSSNKDWDEITCNWNASGYRLPTEAEWELAARGGNKDADPWKYTYAGTNEEDTLKNYAWYSGNSSRKTHEVGTKAANGLKLYDMSGNVMEWCWDWWASIEAGTASGGAASGSYRVFRMGGWNLIAYYCAVSDRSFDNPYYCDSNLGFRLVRSAN